MVVSLVDGTPLVFCVIIVTTVDLKYQRKDVAKECGLELEALDEASGQLQAMAFMSLCGQSSPDSKAD